MDKLVVGIWGAFFGTVALMLAASLVAFARSLHRVALTAALSALMSGVFAAAYLGALPVVRPQAEARWLAHVAAVCSTALGLMLLAMLGLMRDELQARRIRRVAAGLATGVLALGWLLDPFHALALSSLWSCGVGAAGLLLCLRGALRGDPLGWLAVAGVSFMLLAVVGLSWIALDRQGVPWPVHAASALAGMAYLATIATAMWARYSYLIELREVLAHGPNYDPVTRLRSHAETAGPMVGAAFFRHEGERRPVGVIAVSIGNLYALENLHGRAAANHALFVCASRLRRCVPAQVEMGRLGDDGFLLLMRNASDTEALLSLARQVGARLLRPVALTTGQQPRQLDNAGMQWVAEVGVGVLQALPMMRPSTAVSMARAMSRTAWTYPSRIAWFDRVTEQIAELPAP
ncbi:GGDEF domain-containing protein [Ramlibacter tataouinensis]|uniref:Candidate membrane protein n=1 Tax=Ramlibacter tataouinensis (strain ATCC BAA-407 / DSM 14655 / LMG 21543 / TTB310) TaxID=365046 RepID=F5XYF9_RAMTT|nr:GGDEF domain-containing protein [Ramlibacter tataouinensis]AEG93135.1 candidate membrane protein [Ramlibacter tataouinensis TTB310]